mgnify:CR=1 FL=1
MKRPRPSDEEFEQLKKKRDQGIREWMAKNGWDPDQTLVHISGSPECYCNCPDGPCQHIWDGPEYTEETAGGEFGGCGGFMSSTTCSRCGAVAAYHDMRCGP